MDRRRGRSGRSRGDAPRAAGAARVSESVGHLQPRRCRLHRVPSGRAVAADLRCTCRPSRAGVAATPPPKPSVTCACGCCGRKPPRRSRDWSPIRRGWSPPSASGEVERLIEILRTREREGEGSRFDRLRAEQELRDARQLVTSAAVSVAEARATLAGMLPPDTRWHGLPRARSEASGRRPRQRR